MAATNDSLIQSRWLAVDPWASRRRMLDDQRRARLTDPAHRSMLIAWTTRSSRRRRCSTRQGCDVSTRSDASRRRRPSAQTAGGLSSPSIPTAAHPRSWWTRAVQLPDWSPRWSVHTSAGSTAARPLTASSVRASCGRRWSPADTTDRHEHGQAWDRLPPCGLRKPRARHRLHERSGDPADASAPFGSTLFVIAPRRARTCSSVPAPATGDCRGRSLRLVAVTPRSSPDGTTLQPLRGEELRGGRSDQGVRGELVQRLPPGQEVPGRPARVLRVVRHRARPEPDLRGPGAQRREEHHPDDRVPRRLAPGGALERGTRRTSSAWSARRCSTPTT